MNVSLCIGKDIDLMRSTFITFGLAELLYSLSTQGTGGSQLIRDEGSVYKIESDLTRDHMVARVRDRGRLPQILPAIVKGMSAKEQAAEGVERIRAEQKYKPLDFRGEVVNYETERDKEGERIEKSKGNRQEGDVLKRPIHYPLWAHLCSYFGKGSAMRKGYPLVLHTWHQHTGEAAEMLLDIILERYGNFPNPTHETEYQWATELLPYMETQETDPFDWQKELKQSGYVTGLAVVSPSTVQGAYSSSGALALNNDTQDIFWLDLYLALVGYMKVGMPYRANKDVLLYYPIPHDIEYMAAVQLMESYQQSNYAQQLYSFSNQIPRAKIDVLCHILYYREVIRSRRQGLEIEASRQPWLANLRVDSIKGLVSYYYKNIATQIPFDETTFALPAWLPPDPTLEELTAAEPILDEHYKMLSRISGDDAEELTIINHYRRFVTFGDADAWIEFANAYGQYQFSKMLDMRWLPTMYFDVLKETLVNSQNDRKNYRPILENSGFLSVASAIRSSTGRLRYEKEVQQKNTGFRVRHGLGSDLKRRAHNPDHFIEDLTDFVHDYMRESDAVRASTGETRHFITLEDLQDVTDLVAHYGSRVIASLLVAAGYTSHYSPSSAKDKTTQETLND